MPCYHIDHDAPIHQLIHRDKLSIEERKWIWTIWFNLTYESWGYLVRSRKNISDQWYLKLTSCSDLCLVCWWSDSARCYDIQVQWCQYPYAAGILWRTLSDTQYRAYSPVLKFMPAISKVLTCWHFWPEVPSNIKGLWSHRCVLTLLTGSHELCCRVRFFIFIWN